MTSPRQAENPFVGTSQTPGPPKMPPGPGIQALLHLMRAKRQGEHRHGVPNLTPIFISRHFHRRPRAHPGHGAPSAGGRRRPHPAFCLIELDLREPVIDRPKRSTPGTSSCAGSGASSSPACMATKSARTPRRLTRAWLRRELSDRRRRRLARRRLPSLRKTAIYDGTKATRWVTRARPKIDRIACPWLIRRFVDPFADFHYVPAPMFSRSRTARRDPVRHSRRRCLASRRAL